MQVHAHTHANTYLPYFDNTSKQSCECNTMINASFDFRSVCDTVAASSLDFYLTESANVCLTEWGDTELYAM